MVLQQRFAFRPTARISPWGLKVGRRYGVRYVIIAHGGVRRWWAVLFGAIRGKRRLATFRTFVRRRQAYRVFALGIVSFMWGVRYR